MPLNDIEVRILTEMESIGILNANYNAVHAYSDIGVQGKTEEAAFDGLVGIGYIKRLSISESTGTFAISDNGRRVLTTTLEERRLMRESIEREARMEEAQIMLAESTIHANIRTTVYNYIAIFVAAVSTGAIIFSAIYTSKSVEVMKQGVSSKDINHLDSTLQINTYKIDSALNENRKILDSIRYLIKPKK